MRLSGFLAAAAVAVFGLATLSTASAAPKELKFGHVGEPGSLFAESAAEFARIANEKLGDRYKVVVYGSSQLGGSGISSGFENFGSSRLSGRCPRLPSITRRAVGLLRRPRLMSPLE